MLTPDQTAENATHLLLCTHRLGRKITHYKMPCHVLKTTMSGRIKILVFGRLFWKGNEHISKVRYVDPGKVVAKLAQNDRQEAAVPA